MEVVIIGEEEVLEVLEEEVRVAAEREAVGKSLKLKI
jgi:hypothetical protein